MLGREDREVLSCSVGFGGAGQGRSGRGFFHPFAPWLAVVLAAAQIGGGAVVNLLCSISEFLIQLKVWNVQDTKRVQGCAGNKYNEKEDFQVLLSKGDRGESSHQKHSRWMAHWTKASSSAEPQDGKSCSPLEDANNGTCTKDSGTSPFELMKSRMAERLMVGVNHERDYVEHAQRLNSNMWSVAHDACQEDEIKKFEQGDGSFQISTMQMQKDVNLYAKTVVSKIFSIRRLSELSLDFQKLVNSDNLNSEWSHFPMFAINRKIDSILNPKRRSANGTMSSDLFVPQQTGKLNMGTSNLMAFSSQEYELQSHQITGEVMDQCKPAGGIISCLEDPTGLISDPAGEKLRGNLPITMSCSRSKDDSHSSSDCLMDEQHTSHYFSNPNQEPHCRSSEKKFKFSENNNKGQIVGNASQNQKSRTPAGLHKHQDAAGVVFGASVLGKDYETEPINYPKKSKQDDEKFHGSYKFHGRVVASPLLCDDNHYLNTHRMESAAKVTDSYMLSDPTANILTVNSKGDAVTHERLPVDKFTDSSKQKGPYLFEMLTTPSKSQSAYPKHSLSSEKSTGLGVCMYGTDIGSHLFAAQNQSPVKTETLYSDMQYVSKSSAGIVSSLAQKDNGCAKKAKPEQLATLSMKGASGYSKQNEFHNVNEHQDVSSKATIASKQGCCLPGTENMDLDLILFQVSRMRNQVSNGAIRAPARTEPSDRWLKRLQLDISDPHVPGSKRSKFGDGRPVGETSGMFGMAPQHDGSDTDMVDCINEERVLDEGIKLQGIQERSPLPTKNVNCWLGRWCQGGTPVSHEDPDQRKQAAKPELASEELEGQFPSITAMAMMGRAMSKVRPCDHKRKGPFVVWKTEGA